MEGGGKSDDAGGGGPESGDFSGLEGIEGGPVGCGGKDCAESAIPDLKRLVSLDKKMAKRARKPTCSIPQKAKMR